MMESSYNGVLKARDESLPATGVTGSYTTISPYRVYPGLWYSGKAVTADATIAHETGSKKLQFKSCFHYERYHGPTTPQSLYYIRYPNVHWYVGAQDFPHIYDPGGVGSYQVPPEFDSALTELAPLSESIIREQSVLALRDMMPSILDYGGGVSVANFLLELRDIKSMFKLWRRPRGRDVGFFRNLYHNTAAGVLNWEFGWKPFIQDMGNIARLFDDVHGRIKQWNADARKGVIYVRHADRTTHANMVDSKTEEVDPYLGWTSISAGGSVRRFRKTTEETKGARLVYTLAFKPQYWECDDAIEFARFFLQALGVGNMASVLWDAVPFSFLLDWVYGLGDFLDSLEQEVMGLPIRIVEFGYSVKADRIQTYRLREEHNTLGYTFDYDTFCHETMTKYYRRQRIPPPIEHIDDVDWDALLHFKLPSLKQAYLGLNLGVALATGTDWSKTKSALSSLIDGVYTE